MARPFKLEVQESEAELKHRLHHAGHVSETEKLQMLWWVKSGQVSQQQEIATRLGRDRSTITRWLEKYRRGGLKDLLSINTAPSAKPSLNPSGLLSS
jgi:transposase-like protein